MTAERGGGNRSGGRRSDGRRRPRGGTSQGGRGRGREAPRGTGPVRRPEGEATEEVRGILQVHADGYGFLRDPRQNLQSDPGDTFVPAEMIRQLGVEGGVELAGMAIPTGGNRGPWLDGVATVDGFDPETWKERRRPFKNLVAEAPDERIRLETTKQEIATRVIDIVAPIGKGQRCLIVAAPKTGKTMLLQKLAAAITENHPDIHLMVLLVDERPEEVTDMRRTVQGEVLASSSDETPREHIRLAEMVLERAKRLIECGRDVVVLLDSITRLARAYNSEQRGSGRVLSGGIDSRTMEKPRKFFGAARKAEGGGSLTVIATALVDTGSRMDEVIFQEFKGTGNMEIVLDRNLFERRIFPTIDISQTGTRREELLLTDHEYQRISLLRRALARVRPAEAMEMLIDKLNASESNEAFLEKLGG